MAEWWSIEVFDVTAGPARQWQDAHSDALTEAAITHGARYWEWHHTQYGVIFEVLFDTDDQWEAFKDLLAVRTALDAVPDPEHGLIIYRGRGGGAGSRKPRKPKPAPSAAAAELPEPEQVRRVRLLTSEPPSRPPAPPSRPPAPPSRPPAPPSSTAPPQPPGLVPERS